MKQRLTVAELKARNKRRAAIRVQRLMEQKALRNVAPRGLEDWRKKPTPGYLNGK